jgi:hypothetical protein
MSEMKSPYEEMIEAMDSIKPKQKIIYIGENRTVEEFMDLIKSAIPDVPIVINTDNQLIAGHFGEFMLVNSKSKLEELKMTHVLYDERPLELEREIMEFDAMMVPEIKTPNDTEPKNRKERRDALKARKSNYTRD